jgi:NTE family protein
VNASCAVPFFFEPVKMYGKTFVDGGILDNVPADICRKLGAKVVIAVDIMTFDNTSAGLDNMLKVLRRSLSIASGHLKAEMMAQADVLIVPDLKGIPYMSGARNKDACDAGYAATLLSMPQILELMAKHGIPPEKSG